MIGLEYSMNANSDPSKFLYRGDTSDLFLLRLNAPSMVLAPEMSSIVWYKSINSIWFSSIF